MEGQLEGQQIGRYLVRRRLGGGGVATVYEAYDQVAGQSVALKVLPPNPDEATLKRFRREALLAGALHHPHIVRILQVGTVGDGASSYIAMDLVEGESLAALLTRFGQLRPDESCRLLEPVARALAYAHQHAVVHRDVKPSNILLRPVNMRSDPPSAQNGVRLDLLDYPVVPLLSDFGIARYLDAPELTHEGRTVGTPAFMAPEQCMGSREVDGRADIYSLGTVLYRCVVGKLPFNGSTTQILHAHVFEPVVLDDETIQSLPPKVVEILKRTLAKAPEDRYQDADEFADDLAQVGASAPESAAEQSAGDSDVATLAMATLPVTTPTASTALQVLVPGSGNFERAGSELGTSAKKKRRRRPAWDTLLWSLFFLVMIGAVLWNVRSWFLQDAPTDVGLNSRLVLVTFTPIVASNASQSAQPATSAPTAPAVEAVVAPAATALPSATLEPLPTLTAVPTIIPTEVPLEAPTDAPEVVTAPTPQSTPTVVESQQITPSEETIGTCLTVVDDFFLAAVQAIPSDLQADFFCPTKAADSYSGLWMPFAQGVMVALDGAPLVYVYYADGAWEQVSTGDNSGSSGTLSTEGGDSGSSAPAPFAQILASEGRSFLLGDPTQSEPMHAETLVQPFSGGVIVGNKANGQILLLARSKLRF